MRDTIKEETLKHMAQNALRTIAIGFKDMSYAEYKKAIGEYASPDKAQESPQIEMPSPEKFIEEKQEDLLFDENSFQDSSEDEMAAIKKKPKLLQKDS